MKEPKLTKEEWIAIMTLIFPNEFLKRLSEIKKKYEQ